VVKQQLLAKKSPNGYMIPALLRIYNIEKYVGSRFARLIIINLF
jgi:hypothetical protein